MRLEGSSWAEDDDAWFRVAYTSILCNCAEDVSHVTFNCVIHNPSQFLRLCGSCIIAYRLSRYCRCRSGASKSKLGDTTLSYTTNYPVTADRNNLQSTSTYKQLCTFEWYASSPVSVWVGESPDAFPMWASTTVMRLLWTFTGLAIGRRSEASVRAEVSPWLVPSSNRSIAVRTMIRQKVIGIIWPIWNSVSLEDRISYLVECALYHIQYI